MQVRELIKLLAKHPDDMRVVLHFEEGTGYDDVGALEVVGIERDANVPKNAGMAGMARQGSETPWATLPLSKMRS